MNHHHHASTVSMRRAAKLTSAAMIAGLVTFAASAPARAEDPTIDVSVDLAAAVDDAASLAAIEAETGTVMTRPLLASQGIYEFTAVVEVKLKEADDPKKLADAVKDAQKVLEKSDHVEWSEPGDQSTVKDDRFYAWPATTSEHADASQLIGQPALADLDLAAVHGTATGVGSVVAVLDTGVDADHEFFHGRILAGYDMVDDDDNPDELADGIDQDGDGTADDAHGHGTFVAGIVLQIAPDATILPVRVLDAEGNGDRYAVVAGIEFAVNQGADIINLSFGLDGELGSKRLEEAVKWAKKQGVVVVAAAGNNADENKHFPAALNDVISVTALGDTNHDVAGYANYGKWVTVAAPGNNIVSTTADGGYARWSGTSMASPVVSGAYAVVSEHLDGEKYKTVVEAITKHVWKMGKKDVVDKGILNLVAAVSQ